MRALAASVGSTPANASSIGIYEGELTMTTSAMRVTVMAVAISWGCLADQAEAGLRHMRLFQSNGGCNRCCSASCGLANSCGCGAPVYVTPPMATCACGNFESAWPTSTWSPASNLDGSVIAAQPNWTVADSVGDGGPVPFESSLNPTPLIGPSGSVVPFHGGGFRGTLSVGGMPPLPGNYAPLSAQYAPYPRPHTVNIVW